MIYKCRNCGGNAVYSPKKKQMWCPHCESTDSEEKIGMTAITHCGNCGAPLDKVTEYTSALKCGHCGSYIILEERVEGKNRPELILPFEVSKEEAVKCLKKEFKRRAFTPTSFLSYSSLECMEGSYIPFWLYDYLSKVEYDGKATKIRVYRSGDTEYTETSHYRVIRKMDIQFDKIPVDASKRMEDDIMDLMEPYEYRALQNFQEKYMSGFEGEIYNFPETEGEDRALKRVKTDSETLLHETMAGYNTNVPVHKSIMPMKKKAHFALLPVWVYRYMFQGKEYMYYVNGQTGKVIGKTPTDGKKAMLYSATVAGIVMMICQCLGWILEVL